MSSNGGIHPLITSLTSQETSFSFWAFCAT